MLKNALLEAAKFRFQKTPINTLENMVNFYQGEVEKLPIDSKLQDSLKGHTFNILNNQLQGYDYGRFWMSLFLLNNDHQISEENLGDYSQIANISWSLNSYALSREDIINVEDYLNIPNSAKHITLSPDDPRDMSFLNDAKISPEFFWGELITLGISTFLTDYFKLSQGLLLTYSYMKEDSASKIKDQLSELKKIYDNLNINKSITDRCTFDILGSSMYLIQPRIGTMGSVTTVPFYATETIEQHGFHDQELKIHELIDLYFSTLTKLSIYASEKEIDEFGKSFIHVLKNSPYTKGQSEKPLVEFCRKIQDTNNITKEDIHTFGQLYATKIIAAGLSKDATIRYALEQENLEKKAFMIPLLDYMQNKPQESLRWDKYGKYWYTDIVNTTTMGTLNYSDIQNWTEYTQSLFNKLDFTDKKSVKYTDNGAFKGEKTVVALEELCKSIPKTIEEIIIEINEPSPGLRAHAYNNLERTARELREKYGIEITILENTSDVTNLRKHPVTNDEETLNIYAFQNIWTNYENWQELQLQLNVQAGNVIIFEGDAEKDLEEYKRQSAIGEKHLRRYGITRQDIDETFSNNGFDSVMKEKNGHIRKYVKLKKDVHAHLNNNYAFYDRENNKLIFNPDQEFDRQNGLEKVILHKGQIIQTLLSQSFNMDEVDEFYISGFQNLKGTLITTSEDNRHRAYVFQDR